MNSKNLMVVAVVMAVILLVLVPYLQFVIQRGSLDSDLAMIMMDYNTVGQKRFLARIDEICLKARLEPGSYGVTVDEDKNSSRVIVEIRYRAKFKILFFEHTEDVTLINETKNLGL